MTQGTSLAVDIGGTFTDVVLQRGAEAFVAKTLTTPDDLLIGFLRGIDSALKNARLTTKDVDGFLVHATTVVTNALIERRGVKTAMLFTEGFRDILEIRNEHRYDMYDAQIEFPHPLIDADARFTIAERVLADGTVEQTPDDAEIDALAAVLEARGIASVGICFLHSYKNPANERRVGERLQKQLPSLHISLSSDVAPQIREYLRASTTAANAYAVAITKPYLDRLESRVKEDGINAQPLIMLSSGGVVGPATAGRLPVRMIESGPAAGALGAAFIAKALGQPDLLAFDMGGTTAKVCLIQQYQPLVTGLFEVDRIYRLKEGSGLPVSVPCIDLIEIGAGGGSIAHVGDLGLLKVGPRSAGAKPGPACYGHGGTEATVTDADIVLGLLDPRNFLGGAMQLHEKAALAAVEKLAKKLDISVIATARGIYQIVCEAMAGAVRAHATERGVDYRGIPLLAFGGAGPVHACGVAALLNSRTVIFPPLASVLSAFGSLVTPPRLDLVRSSLSRVSSMNWDAVGRLYDEMEREGREALMLAGAKNDAITFKYSADMRYLGQHYELPVRFETRPTAAHGARMLRDNFEREYRKRYTLTQGPVDVEVVTWRIAAVGATAEAPQVYRPVNGVADPAKYRPVPLWDGEQDVRVMPRAEFGRHGTLKGPLILEERETTLVIPPGWTAAMGTLGCIVATRGD
jgi:N-methylhydantoinase A